MKKYNNEHRICHNQYEWFDGVIRFCIGHPNGILKVPGKLFSLHINTYADRGGKYIPKCLKNKAPNYHIAFITKFPFVIIGFNKLNKYMRWR